MLHVHSGKRGECGGVARYVRGMCSSHVGDLLTQLGILDNIRVRVNLVWGGKATLKIIWWVDVGTRSKHIGAWCTQLLLLSPNTCHVDTLEVLSFV